jgi:hsp70-interacting protein
MATSCVPLLKFATSTQFAVNDSTHRKNIDLPQVIFIKIMDRGLNELLKWSIENSDTNATKNSDGTSEAAPAPRPLNTEALSALFGGPSDAELMRAAMDVVISTDSDVTLDNKLVAFDNFEQLVESLDNANNLSNLSLWTPLLSTLAHAEAELRLMGAWCVGTAVQNNEPSQERLLAMGGIPRLVHLVLRADERPDVRKKGIYALSSACRNYQPAMDECLKELGKKGRAADFPEQVDAMNMDAVDVVMNKLKEEAKGPETS